MIHYLVDTEARASAATNAENISTNTSGLNEIVSILNVNTVSLEIPDTLHDYLLARYDSLRIAPYVPSSDNTWLDYSGNSRNITLANLAYTPDSTLTPTNGLELDGVEDKGEMADSAATRLITGGTLCAWIYPKTIGATAGKIIDKSTTTSGGNGYTFGLRSTNNALASFVNDGNVLLSADDSITFNAWQHVTMTFDGTGRHLYVNGVDVTSSGEDETALPPDVAGVVAIGNRAVATDRTFDGYIDKVMMFNRALTVAEVLHIYLVSKGRYGV